MPSWRDGQTILEQHPLLGRSKPTGAAAIAWTSNPTGASASPAPSSPQWNTRDPFYYPGLILIPAGMNNHMLSKVRDDITYPSQHWLLTVRSRVRGPHSSRTSVGSMYHPFHSVFHHTCSTRYLKHEFPLDSCDTVTVTLRLLYWELFHYPSTSEQIVKYMAQATGPRLNIRKDVFP